MEHCSLRVSKETPGLARAWRVCFAAALMQPKISSRQEQCQGLGSRTRQGHPAPHGAFCARTSARHDPPAAPASAATSLPPLPLRSAGRIGPQGHDFFTQHEVKVGGRQGKQNKSVLPGTCSPPCKKLPTAHHLRASPFPLRHGVVFHCPFILG